MIYAMDLQERAIELILKLKNNYEYKIADEDLIVLEYILGQKDHQTLLKSLGKDKKSNINIKKRDK